MSVLKGSLLSMSLAAPIPIKTWKHGGGGGMVLSPSLPRLRFKKCRISAQPSHHKVNEGVKEDLDHILGNYGEVAFTDAHNKSHVADADDDSESLSLAMALAKVASDVKAADIRVLYVKPLVYWTHFFVIATAFSNPQIDAMGSKIRDVAEQQFKISSAGDTKPNSWMLLDFGDVVVHIFLPDSRAHYNLEEFYANATVVDLPFRT